MCQFFPEGPFQPVKKRKLPQESGKERKENNLNSSACLEKNREEAKGQQRTRMALPSFLKEKNYPWIRCYWQMDVNLLIG